MSRQRVVILGGGMASLVTAFELTRTPASRQRHEVTVLQHGHRLGGKGASSVNADLHNRIEEHGLHILWGFYENAFRILRECYDELGREPGTPLATWQDAVKPQDLIVLPERIGDQIEWWPMYSPPNDEVPGDGGVIDDPWRYLVRLFDWVTGILRQWVSSPDDEASTSWPQELRAAMDAPGERLLRGLLRRLVFRRNAEGQLSALSLAQIARRLVATLPAREAPGEDDRRSLLWVIERSLDWVWARSNLTTEMRRTRHLIDLALTIARGIIVDGLIASPQRWFEIDDEDFSVWLRRHGARPDTVDGALVRGLYHAAFSVHEPIGAGTILHALLRMVSTYKGSILYRMQAGMGDTVFAPLYEVLRRRGVRFEFFRSVRSVELSPDKQRVARVVVDRQATVRAGAYEPLVDVDGLPCWPHRPRHEQLVEGAALAASGQDLDDWWNTWPAVGQDVLEAGRHFDVCVLGISLGALPEICRELVEDAANPRFRAMVERVRTTQTQAAQLWFDRDLRGLGWAGSTGPQPPILIPFDDPFDTWSDMSYLLAREGWPADAQPANLAYLCAPLQDAEPLAPRDDHAYPARQKARVRGHLVGWLEQHATKLWPEVAAGGGFAWERLVDHGGREGVARVDGQHYCAVNHPSDRYVLSVPGSSRCRLRADESGYDNLVLAGDWTRTALSIGCLEAATMSGFAAARAIDAQSRRAYGDWLPERPPLEREQSGRAAELPPYISNGQLIAIPPLRMRTRLAMFFLEASLPKLQALCDRYLNLPGSDTTYRPLGPQIALYCSHADTGPIDDPIGWCPEKDFGFWVPLVARDPRGVERHVTYTPWLWVDSGVAAAGGREVYGFGKELGRLRMPDDVDTPNEYSVDTLVLPKYGPDRRVVEQRLLTIRPQGQRAPRLSSLLAGGDRVLRQLDHLMSPGVPSAYLGFARSVLARQELRMVFLKQFPDVVHATRACYQAIVEAPIKITGGVRGGLLPGGFEVTIHEAASHPIVEALGLRTIRRDVERAQLRPVLSTWLAFDAQVDPGEVVWESVIHQRARSTLRVDRVKRG